MPISPVAKTIEVRDSHQVALFETLWWKLYWQRVNPEAMPAQFKWIAKGKPEYPREFTMEERN
jgi:hypothetical protein